MQVSLRKAMEEMGQVSKLLDSILKRLDEAEARISELEDEKASLRTLSITVMLKKEDEDVTKMILRISSS
ncbi:hypothetical protein KUCAC02_020777 [Chaenocephalus aceratus]|uniref:Uncharacterized protein n=1 Tax=Chaenocephalus aceratus TaxID=36190 RepID=A0ACB9XDF8_CHAAC|nr:hypothetical protein KUCAC02_020777 [Chaenocephalus aceratus]